jgi:hypothetical protein
MHIKKPIGKKAIVSFPDTPVKPVAMPRPAVSAPIKETLNRFLID